MAHRLRPNRHARRVAGVRSRASMPRESGPRVIDVSALPPFRASALPSSRSAWWAGEKFPGGLGPASVLATDYWTLRAWSAELYKTNLYARGIIRRFVQNVINTGLHLEAQPEEEILGYAQGELAAWSEDVENRFRLWGRTPRLCDRSEQRTFGGLQEEVYQEALIEGDILAMIVMDPVTELPRVRLVPGSAVQTPIVWEDLGPGRRIIHGVELDDASRHLAYWVRHRDGTHQRVPATHNGRRIAWLVYGTDKRRDEVRGEPLLSIAIQSLKEIDRYRDSVQRKAIINSMIAMFVTKKDELAGTEPFLGAALAAGPMESDLEGPQGEPRRFNAAEYIPGAVIDELQAGEEIRPVSSQGTDEKFGDFEAALIYTVAWANSVPPEILTLTFRNNYSASQAATNEFKIVLNFLRAKFGDAFCQPIYSEWLINEVSHRRIIAVGLLEALRDPWQYATSEAWLSAEWCGHIKPAIDVTKLVKGYREMIAEGFITRARAARELTGTKFSKNVQQLEIENQMLAKAKAIFAADGEARATSLNAKLADALQILTELQEKLEAVESEAA